MNTGNPNLKNNKIIIAIFLIIFWLFFIYCICIIPSYLFEKSMGYNTQPWAYFNYNLYHSFIGNIYDKLIYKIPDYTIIPAFIVNVGNMILGFKYYKKKWWYYLILVLSIMCSILLLDYYTIYNYDDV
jgi:hypothetical protein